MLIKGVVNPDKMLALTRFIDRHVAVPDGTNEEVMAWILECVRKGDVANLLGDPHDHYTEEDCVPFARILKANSFAGQEGTMFNVTVEVRRSVFIFHDYGDEKGEEFADRGREFMCVDVPLVFYMKVLSLMGITELPQ